jgi:hypothetical protein
MAESPARDGLTDDRIRVYSRVLLVVFSRLWRADPAVAARLVDPRGKPVGDDFIAFWSGGLARLAGTARGRARLADHRRRTRGAVPPYTPISMAQIPLNAGGG